MSFIVLLVLCYYVKLHLKNVYLTVKFFLCIPASAGDAAAFNSKTIKMLLANGLITFFINGNPVFSNGPRSQPRNPDCIILNHNKVFDNLISVDKLFATAVQRFATCLLISNNL